MEQQLRQLIRDAVREVMREELGTKIDGRAPLRNATDTYISVATAACVAGVAPGTIRAWIRQGRLDFRRAGRVIRVGRAELERFMSGVPSATQQAETRARANQLLQRDQSRRSGRDAISVAPKASELTGQARASAVHPAKR